MNKYPTVQLSMKYNCDTVLVIKEFADLMYVGKIVGKNIEIFPVPNEDVCLETYKKVKDE